MEELTVPDISADPQQALAAAEAERATAAPLTEAASIAGHHLYQARSAFLDAGTPAPQEYVPAAMSRDCELMMSFESFGGHFGGCEFGLVQRWHGAEPLGLLRWTTMTQHTLAEALAERFAGVGDPEQTKLFVHENGEYFSQDKRFLMAMHLFVNATDVSPDEMMRRVCRRIQFLREKMIADLTDGHRIFVFRVTTGPLTEEELVAIRRGMRQYGHNTLLYVRLADEQHPAGTLECPEDGLMIGHLERFEAQPAEEAAKLWAPVCRAAREMVPL